MARFLLHWLVTAVALGAATRLVPGIHIASGPVLVFAALVLGFVNAIVRPVLVLLTLPLTVLTLGIFYFIVNGAALGNMGLNLDISFKMQLFGHRGVVGLDLLLCRLHRLRLSDMEFFGKRRAGCCQSEKERGCQTFINVSLHCCLRYKSTADFVCYLHVN